MLEKIGILSGWLLPILAAVLAWYCVEMVAKPFVRFREIRRACEAILIKSVFDIFITPNSLAAKEYRAALDAEIHKSRVGIINLGIELKALASAETLLVKALKFIGYDPEFAALALFAIALTEDADEDKREFSEDMLRLSLRLPALKRPSGKLPDLLKP
jgi:hypothetical protein